MSTHPLVEGGTISALDYSAQDAAAQLERSPHILLVNVHLRPISHWGYQWNITAHSAHESADPTTSSQTLAGTRMRGCSMTPSSYMHTPKMITKVISGDIFLSTNLRYTLYRSGAGKPRCRVDDWRGLSNYRWEPDWATCTIGTVSTELAALVARLVQGVLPVATSCWEVRA